MLYMLVFLLLALILSVISLEVFLQICVWIYIFNIKLDSLRMDITAIMFHIQNIPKVTGH